MEGRLYTEPGLLSAIFHAIGSVRARTDSAIRRWVGAEILLSVTGNERAAPMMLLRERDVLLSAVGSGLALVVLAKARLTGLPSVPEPVVIGGS
jgi:uncharacterized phage infection (PIP) family protein YhgE